LNFGETKSVGKICSQLFKLFNFGKYGKIPIFGSSVKGG